MWDWLSKAKELRDAGQPFALVTIVGVKGSTPRDAGAKLLVERDGSFHGTVGGGQLEQLVIQDAVAALAEAVSRPRHYPLCFRTGQCCGGAVESFIEIVGVGPRLYLFGAGHVGRSLCQTLAETPFTVHLIDERDAWVSSPEIPTGVVRHAQPWHEFVQEAAWDKERTYVAVMTHEHALDLAIIRDVIERPARFIGLIGSVTKWDRFRQRLAALGANEDMMGRVHCPIGSGRFGKAPREVAISVAAQLLELHHGD